MKNDGKTSFRNGSWFLCSAKSDERSAITVFRNLNGRNSTQWSLLPFDCLPGAAARSPLKTIHWIVFRALRTPDPMRFPPLAVIGSSPKALFTNDPDL